MTRASFGCLALLVLLGATGALADLVFESGGLTTSPLLPGASPKKFKALITIYNDGLVASNKTKLKVWANEPASQNCTSAAGKATKDIKIVNVPAINPLTYWSTTVPGLSATAGNNTLRVLIDFECKLTGIVGGQGTFSYSANQTLPDLTVPFSPSAGTGIFGTYGGNPIPAPINVLAGGTFDILVPVRNDGSVPGKVGTIKVFTEVNGSAPSPCNATAAKSVKIGGSVGPGLTKWFKITKITSPAAAGSFTGYAAVDADCATAESSDANNIESFGYSAYTEKLPSFEVDPTSFKALSSVKPKNGPPKANGAIDFTFKVRNVGLGKGAVGVVSILADSKGIPYSCGPSVLNGTWVKSKEFKNNLAPGKDVVVKINAVKAANVSKAAIAAIVPNAACATETLTNSTSFPFEYAVAPAS